MYERWRLMRKAAAEKSAEKAATDTKAQVTSASAILPASNLHKEHIEFASSISNSDIQPAVTNGKLTMWQSEIGRVTSSMTNNFALILHFVFCYVNVCYVGRIRIAHVPYAKSLAMEKKKVAVTLAKNKEDQGTDNKTTAQTTKGGVRVAHIPQVVSFCHKIVSISFRDMRIFFDYIFDFRLQVPQLVRPEPLQVATHKFSLNIRQYYINMMHDVCMQIYTTGDDAAQRAVKEEYACHEKCKALLVYKNSCMLAIHRLRKEIEQDNSNEKISGSSYGMVSHEAVLAGKSKGSWSVVKNKKNIVDFKGAALYNMLKKWIMSEEQLRNNGFPRHYPDGTKVIKEKVFCVIKQKRKD